MRKPRGSPTSSTTLSLRCPGSTRLPRPATATEWSGTTMSDEELRDYAAALILEHAYGVEHLTIHEMAEDYGPGAEISNDDARKVSDLIAKAVVTVSWDEDTVYS